MRIMLLIALALIPLSVVACPPSSTHRVICRDTAPDDLVMSCERWSLMVSAAHQFGPQRYIAIMRNYVQGRPMQQQQWIMLFSLDAASFAHANKFRDAQTALDAALVTCGKFGVS